MRTFVLGLFGFLAACSSSSTSATQSEDADAEPAETLAVDSGTSETRTDGGADVAVEVADAAADAITDADLATNQKAWCDAGAPRLTWAAVGGFCEDTTYEGRCQFDRTAAGVRCVPWPALHVAGFPDAGCAATAPMYLDATTTARAASVLQPDGSFAAYATSVTPTPASGDWYAVDGVCTRQTVAFPYTVIGGGTLEADSLIDPSTLCEAGAASCL